VKEKYYFTFGYELLTAVVCLFFIQTYDYSLRSLIALLTAFCLLGAKLILCLVVRNRGVVFIVIAVVFAVTALQTAEFILTGAVPSGVFVNGDTALSFIGYGSLFPLMCLLITEFCEEALGIKWFVQISLATGILLAFILRPPAACIAIAGVIDAAAIFVYILLSKLGTAGKQIERRSDEIRELNQRMGEQRQAAQSLEALTRLTERNRLAARIHDDVGHGVSGSILLLEAALLTLKTDPAKAEDIIVTATENLRDSVDDIRVTLREERSELKQVGLAQITATLSKFEAEHPEIRTELNSEGTLDDIPPSVWLCIHENLKEALTNLLKHSNGNRFQLDISTRNKLLQVELVDNGTLHGRKRNPSSHTIQYENSPENRAPAGGMGLFNMEERCALLGGRFFATKGDRGFRIKMIFPAKT
jgi:signal transduction histidine kinase